MLDASLILVNFRSEGALHRCLRHLAQLAARGESMREIVIVDNSAGSGLAQTRLPAELSALKVRLLTATHNLGFAAAVNRGAAAACGKTLVLLNPDALPAPGCLAGLVVALQEHPEVGLAAPRLTPVADGEALPSATRIDPNALTCLVENTALHRFLPRDWLARRYFADPAAGRQTCATLQGACLAVPRTLFRDLGGFDERFFVYWEDTDLARRVRLAGHTVLYCPELECEHEGGHSSADEATRQTLFWRSANAYHRKWGGAARAAALRLLLPLGMAAEWCVLALLHQLRRGRDPVLRRDLELMGVRLQRQLGQRAALGRAPR